MHCTVSTDIVWCDPGFLPVLTMHCREALHHRPNSSLLAHLLIRYEEAALTAACCVQAQLLIDKSQVGCLIGKGGEIVKALRNESQAQIHIGTKDRPVIAADTDELVQITGQRAQVEHALKKMCEKLRSHPAKPKVSPRSQ